MTLCTICMCTYIVLKVRGTEEGERDGEGRGRGEKEKGGVISCAHGPK